MARRRLTEKQKRFIEEFLIDLNATRAAIRAGYSANTASSKGFTLLQDDLISAAIAKAKAERSRRTGISQDRVIRELARIAFVKITDIVDVNEATVLDDASDDDRAAIESIRVKKIPTQSGIGIEREVKVSSKIRALELLGKHLGMWDDRASVNVSVPIIIKDDVDE